MRRYSALHGTGKVVNLPIGRAAWTLLLQSRKNTWPIDSTVVCWFVLNRALESAQGDVPEEQLKETVTDGQYRRILEVLCDEAGFLVEHKVETSNMLLMSLLVCSNHDECIRYRKR